MEGPVYTEAATASVAGFKSVRFVENAKTVTRVNNAQMKKER
jgi:hypothetical protein